MKTLRLLSTAALVLLLAACEKETNQVEPVIPGETAQEGIHFSATITGPSATKTTYTEVGTSINVVWKEGDQVALVHNGVVDVAEVKTVDGSGNATIEATITGNPSDDDVVYLVYPANAVYSATPVPPSFPFTPAPACWENLKSQDGTLDYIQNNIDFRIGSGKLAVSGSDASLKASVLMPSFISIWKLTLLDPWSKPLPATALNIVVDGVSQSAATSITAKDVYYLAVFSSQVPKNKLLSIRATVGPDMYTYTRESGLSLTDGKYYQSTVTMTSATAPLPGVFTVDAGKTVKFSKGNLRARYNGSAWVWSFAEDQWDFVGNAAANTSINGDGTIDGFGAVDLFGWVGASNTTWTGVAQYGISNSTQVNSTDTYGNVPSEALKDDWGNTMGDDWSTLTSNEWAYLLGERDGARYCKATVNSTTGLVIFPDSYSHPTDVDAVKSANTTTAAYDTNSWSGENWTKMEAAGAVFLPAACSRYGKMIFTGSGLYWSSTSYQANTAYGLNFSSTGMNPTGTTVRSNGGSVRLVKVQQ